MKEKTLKILILVLCITFALFGVACNTITPSTESESTSESEKSCENGHAYGEWIVYGGDGLDCSERMFYRECGVCGDISWTKGNEDFHKWINRTVEPTCTAEGYDHKTCSVCGKEEKENFVGVIDHEFETDYTFDNDYHWFKCKNCMETTVKEEHEKGTKGECIDCGFFESTEGVIYSVSNGVATVTGYKGTETDIVIAKVYNGYPVTSIGERAFDYCSSLRSVVIGDSVTSIGNSAFSYCYSLTSLVIGDSVTSIGDFAFCYCESLTSVVIGDSVTSIGRSAFSGCESLTSVVIPDSVTNIGFGAFAWCDSLTSVVIGDSVTSIGKEAFYSCYSLTSVYYKGTATDWNKISIGAYNSDLTSTTKRYYYSENKPTTSGNYWHYDENGEIVIW